MELFFKIILSLEQLIKILSWEKTQCCSSTVLHNGWSTSQNRWLWGVSAGILITEASALDEVVPVLSPAWWTFAGCPPPFLIPLFKYCPLSHKGHCAHKTLKKWVASSGQKLFGEMLRLLMKAFHIAKCRPKSIVHVNNDPVLPARFCHSCSDKDGRNFAFKL